MRLHLSVKATEDIESICDYISDNLENKIAALDLLKEITSALDLISLFPESCPLVNNEFVMDKSLRKLVVKNYLIFYRVDCYSDEITVVRVLYGMSDYSKIL